MSQAINVDNPANSATFSTGLRDFPIGTASYYFLYSTDPSFAAQVKNTSVATVDVTGNSFTYQVSQQVFNLTSSTTYYFHSVAVTSTGQQIVGGTVSLFVLVRVRTSLFLSLCLIDPVLPPKCPVNGQIHGLVRREPQLIRDPRVNPPPST